MHSTAMHVCGWFENEPSTSQKGNSSLVHVPSMHDRGFGVVPHPAANAAAIPAARNNRFIDP
jgi:hypothetical protein